MNRLEKLQQALQKTVRGTQVNNQHLANITGFSRPSISQAINSGKINQRMNRVLDLVDLVIEAYDITGLWSLAEGQKGKLTLSEWASLKVDKQLSTYRFLEEEQLDLVETYDRPPVPAWIPLQLQEYAEQLTSEQLKTVVELGEISQAGAIGAFKEFAKNSSESDAVINAGVAI
ncbi:hypothetical protein KCG43_20205 [Photobacterium sp. WH24]|uniref:hypothetical protein n=1 Tax=Photobacterium sp. WH24 TaxID=2827237 RepID=UPI001C453ADF|nr:hypothetical protein [Photobacterium sp. WH24]MBV7264338.1 hypothetical protein [Photobacterium sp. WH24]